jgi:hypothetical protein
MHLIMELMERLRYNHGSPTQLETEEVVVVLGLWYEKDVRIG